MGGFFDFRPRPFSSELNAFLRSFRRRKQILKAMSPTAMTKAATAATESPAIWAGVILGGCSTATGMAADVVEGVEVAEGREDIESTMTD